MDQTQKIVSSIIKFLKTTGKLELLPKVIQRLKLESAQIEWENTAIVTSAYPLSKEELNEIEKQIISLFEKKLEIVNKVDKEVVGGFVIQVSDEIIDLSLGNYLTSIEEKLKNEKN